MSKNLPAIKKNTNKALDFKTFIKSKQAVLLITTLIVIFIISAVFFAIGVSNASNSAYETYQNTLIEQKNSIKNEYLNAVRQTAENRYHVSNAATVNINFTEDVSRLEVLSVCDTAYAIHDDKSIIWAEITGTGTYTVDLESAEIITDNEHGYVWVRALRPEMTSFKLDRVNILYNKSKNHFDNGSVSHGEELALKDRAEAERNIQNRMLNNLDYYNAAEKSAREMIKDLLNSLNPDKELTVEVEFVDISKE